MATIKDVAHVAGVSTASVSRVFSDHPSVSAELRDRVLLAAQQFNYTPNALGRALRTTETQTIGLVVSDLLNPFFAELARSVEDAARGAGYVVIMGNADENPSQQDQYVQYLLSRHLDGLIVVPTAETSVLLQRAAMQQRNIVLVDRPARDVAAPLIASSSDQAIGELVDHLVATGRTRIGVIAGPEAAGSARERLASVESGLARHGLELPRDYKFRGDFRRRSGLDGMNHFLSMANRPDAVVIVNGQMAIGALEAITAAAVPPDVPGELAIAAVDDLDVFRLVRPTITAIAQPTEQLGRLAFHMLLARINGEVVPDQRIACQLLLRGSTAPTRHGGSK